MHHPLIVAEIRELTPEGGWRQYEPTGHACVVCPCGLNTGFIGKTEAATRYREHVQANPPAGAVRVHPETGEASSVLAAMLGEITRSE